MKTSYYKSEYCQMLIEHMSQGFSFSTFGAVVNVGRTTLYDWVDEYPEFKEAKEIAFQKAQRFFEQRLMAKVAGMKIKNVDQKLIDTSCLIFALKTRFHKDYSEKQQVNHTNNGESFDFNIVSTGEKND